MLLLAVLPARAASEAEFRKLSKTYTLRADGSQEMRVQKELTLFTHAAMNGLYGETFIVYNPDFQKLEIHESYTRQKDGTVIQTPANAFVEVLPAAAANAPAYNQLKEMVVVHTGLELGATIVLDYSIVSKAGYLPELDVCCPVKELSPIKEFTFRLNVPAGKSVHYELLNASAQPSIAQREGMKSFTWTLKEVKPRPYAYPSARGSMGQAQAVASGMMPVFVSSTWSRYDEALKSLKAQFQPGNRSVIEAKVAELTRGIQGNPQAIRNAIARYMTELYQLGRCGVSLQDAGYRLRPASEVIRSAYGTQAELANLDVTLQQAAGLEAEVAVCALRPSKAENQGLSTIVSLVAQSKLMPEKVALTGTEEASLQPFLTVISLDGKPLTMEAYLGAKEMQQTDTLRVDEKKLQQPAGHPESGRKEVAAACRRMGNRDTERPDTDPHALCVCCQYNHSREYPSTENYELHAGDHCLPAERNESNSSHQQGNQQCLRKSNIQLPAHERRHESDPQPAHQPSVTDPIKLQRAVCPPGRMERYQ